MVHDAQSNQNENSISTAKVMHMTGFANSVHDDNRHYFISPDISINIA